MKNGKIAQVVNINDFREPSMRYALDFQMVDFLFCGDEDLKQQVVNHSKNIIDLIEVGDYVNGYKVGMIDIDNFDEEGTNKKYLLCGGTAIFEEEIESIVTKEQFAQMEYKVGK